MKRSMSPDPVSSPKTQKLVHHSPDDGEGDLSPPLPATSSGDGIFVEKKPSATFHIDPFTHIVERDSKLFLEDAWKLLQPAINIVFKSPYEEGVFNLINCNAIFSAVKTACLVDPGQVKVLYDLIKQECEPYIASAIQSLVKPSSDDASVFLPLVETCWLGFKWKMMFVFNLAMVMPCERSSLWDVGLALFQKHLSLAPQVQDQVIASILGLVDDERLRKTGDNMSLLKNLMDMFRWQKVVFEKPFLDSTSKFYSTEAEEALQRSNISLYLKYAEETLLGEEEKCKKCYYFYSSCRISVMKSVARELLEVRADALVKGFRVLMDEACVDDLRRMYRVFNYADQMGSLDRIMRSYIQEKGAREESLQEWSSRIKERWRQCFRNDPLLEKSIKESFESLGFRVPGEFSDGEEWESDVD